MPTPHALYLVGENTGTTFNDTATGTAVNLTVTGGTGGAWSSIASGVGYTFGTGNCGAVSGSLSGTKTATAFSGLKTFSAEVRCNMTSSGATQTLIYFGDSTGSFAGIAIQNDFGVVTVYACGTYIGSWDVGTGLHTYTVVVDTTQATAANRVVLYKDGATVTMSGATYPAQNATIDSSITNYANNRISLGCEGAVSVTPANSGTIYYGALYALTESSTDVSANHTALASNNDADPNTVGPTINTQPSSQTVNIGDTPTTLSVSATASPGGGSLSYQWKLNGSNISGETSSTYAFSGAAAFADDGNAYTCLVTDSNGSTLTSQAILTVLAEVAFIAASAVAYSATNPAPTYPSLSANDCLLLIVGQKPATANTGSVTTPTGYTLLDSKLAAGGYSTTLGADTGNCNLYVYKKDSVTGSESGTLTITTSGGTNHVAWAIFVVLRATAGAYDYATATAEDTSAGNLSLAFGAIDVAAQDMLVAAFCQPTDVTTPAQFSAEAFSGTGLTTTTAVEIVEPDSTTGNDIGGVLAYATATAAAGSTAVTFTATAGGTTTNVRGPGILIRVRESAASGSFSGTATMTVSSSGTVTGAGALAGSSSATVSASGLVKGTGALAGSSLATVSAAGAITGTAGVTGTSTATVSASGALTGAGALAGAATMTVSGSGTLSGAGVLAGASSTTLNASGTVTGAGALAGTSNLSLSAAGAVSGAGGLAGASLATLSASGVLTGAGALAGAASMTLSASGTLNVPSGAFTGAAQLSVSASGTLTGTGALAGSSTATVSASGTLTGAGALAGAAALSLSSSGTVTGAGAVVGSALATLSAAGAVTGAGVLAGSSTVTLSASGTMNVPSGAFSGAATMTLAASGTVTGAGAIAGSASLALSSSGTLGGAGVVSGSSTMTVAVTGAITGAGVLAGGVSCSLSASGALKGAGALVGAGGLTVAASGLLKGAGSLAGNSAITLSAAGTMNQPGGPFTAHAFFTISARGTVVPYIQPGTSIGHLNRRTKAVFQGVHASARFGGRAAGIIVVKGTTQAT